MESQSLTSPRVLLYRLLVCGILVLATFQSVLADEPKKVFLGYFEAGRNSVHAALRDEFERQAEILAPAGIQFVFIPQGYRSASWKRDSCRTLARELVNVERVDIMITMGPWVVEDLIEAGYTKPILAMYRFEPFAEGLVDKAGNPLWPNLTVHGKTNKIESDLTTIAGLFHPKKLGFLFFPSGNEHDSVVSGVSFLAKRFGMDLVSATGVDNFGAFAFFKALEQLPKDINALYLGPLWGLDEQKMSSLFDQLTLAGVPVLSYDANPTIQFGALVSDAGYTHAAEARFNAEKLVQILNKERPSDLPTGFAPTVGLTFNMRTLGKLRKPVPAEALREAMTYSSFFPDDVTHFTMTDAVSRTLAHSPSIQVAVEEATSANSAYRVTRASSYPQLKAEGVAMWRDDNTINNLERSLRNDGYRGSLVLEQELFSKTNSFSRSIARMESDTKNAGQGTIRRAIRSQVEHAYLRALESTEQLKIAMQHRLVIDRLREISWPREEFESRPSWERNRLETEHLSATILMNNASASVTSANANLNSLFNLPADAPFVLDSNAFDSRAIYNHYSVFSQIAPTTDGESRLTAFFQEAAQEHNPDINNARLQITVASLKKSAAKASRYPSISLHGSLDFTDEIEESEFFSEKSPSTTISARVELPLFLGGKTGKDIESRTADINRAEFRRDAVSLELMSQVAALSADLFTTLSNVPIAIQQERQSDQNLVEITKEYESGHVSLTEFLDAAEAALRGHEQSRSLQFRYFHIVSDLVHTIGWDVPESAQFDHLFISKIRERFGNADKK